MVSGRSRPRAASGAARAIVQADGGGLEPHGLSATNRLATGDRTFRYHHPPQQCGARRTRTAALRAQPPSKRRRRLVASRSNGRWRIRTPGARTPHPFSRRGRHHVDSPSIHRSIQEINFAWLTPAIGTCKNEKPAGVEADRCVRLRLRVHHPRSFTRRPRRDREELLRDEK
jgi:hypothetical protein